jgi:hypothetical protein
VSWRNRSRASEQALSEPPGRTGMIGRVYPPVGRVCPPCASLKEAVPSGRSPLLVRS